MKSNPKSQTEQRLDLHAVLKLPNSQVVVLSAQSQDYNKQVSFALSSSQTKGKKNPTLIAISKKQDLHVAEGLLELL
jgi:hypothetical protein